MGKKIWSKIKKRVRKIIRICNNITLKHFSLKISHVYRLLHMLNLYLQLQKHARNNDYKSNLHHTRGITPKRTTSGGVYLRGLASELYSSEETSHRCRADDDTASDLTGLGIEPHTSRTESDVFTLYVNQLLR